MASSIDADMVPPLLVLSIPAVNMITVANSTQLGFCFSEARRFSSATTKCTYYAELNTMKTKMGACACATFRK